MRLQFIILLALCILMGACRGRKAPQKATEEAGDIGRPLSEVYDSIGGSFPAWQDVYAPVSLELQAPAQFSISGRATLVRDSLIHISLRKMGMEVAVVCINPDSAFFVDKYHKMYVAEPLSALVPDSLVTLPQLQCLLLGRPFPASDLWFGTTAESPSGAYAMASISLLAGADNQLDFNYFNTADTISGPVPALVQLLAFTPLTNASALVKWQLDKAKWDCGRRPSFKLPSGYDRIDGASLIRAIANQ